jgi:hypothetical protein
VPEVRRLLRVLTAPSEQQGFYLHWSCWRRAHQAVARRGHRARRARAPVPEVPTPSTAPVSTTEHQAAWPGLTDEAWARVQPLLPTRTGRGRPPRQHRRLIAALLWQQHTGASWRALPTQFGPWQTASHRYRTWCADDTWPRLRAALHLTHRDSQVSL